jgi:hypothetical protein
MGVNISKEERDQFAIDLYNETLKAIGKQDRIEYRDLITYLRVFVLNADKFDQYAISCKLDLVLNNMIRSKAIEFSAGFEGQTVLIGFSILS